MPVDAFRALAGRLESSQRVRGVLFLRALRRVLLGQGRATAAGWVATGVVQVRPQHLERVMLRFSVGQAQESAALVSQALNDPRRQLSPETLDRIRRGAGERITNINRTSVRAVRRSILRGTEAGLSPTEIARGANNERVRALRSTGWRPIESVVTETYRNRPQAIVRTELAIANNRGTVDSYRRRGVTLCRIVDGPGCGWRGHDDADVADGSERSLQECEDQPISHPNCFSGSTKVIPLGGVRCVYRSLHSGPMIDIRLAGGSVLTVTPHHPLATLSGWVEAQGVRPGDELLHSTSEPEEASLVSGEADNEHVVPTFEQVFALARESGAASSAVPSALDFDDDSFHGDAQFYQEVSVVDADSFLRRELEARVPQFSSEVFLVEAGTDTLLFPGFGAHGSLSDRVFTTADGVVSGSGIGGVGGTRTDGDAARPEVVENGTTAPTDTQSNLLRRQSCSVQGDKVIDVTHRRAWHGHVYNLESESGMYLANGIVAHNCRRVIRPWLPELPELSAA